MWIASKQPDCLFRLVRLQRADHVQLDAGIAGAPSRPLGLRLLHVILAEDALALVEHRLDPLGRLQLADRDQRHRPRARPAAVQARTIVLRCLSGPCRTSASGKAHARRMETPGSPPVNRPRKLGARKRKERAEARSCRSFGSGWIRTSWSRRPSCRWCSWRRRSEPGRCPDRNRRSRSNGPSGGWPRHVATSTFSEIGPEA